MQLLMQLLARTHYANGWERPMLRGVLHGLIVLLLLPGFIGSCLALLTGNLDTRWWRFAALLAAKLGSHFTSSMLHLFPHSSVISLEAWMKADMVGICFAVWAPTSAFLSGFTEWLLQFLAASAVASAVYSLVEFECTSSEASLKKPAGRRLARVILNLLWFVWCLLLIGFKYGFRGLWVVGAVFYLTAVIISPPFYRMYPELPWHRPKRNGWHEDFHVCVFVADAAFIGMAVEILKM